MGEYNVNVSQNWTVSGGVITYAGFLGTRANPVIDCCVLMFTFANRPGFEYAELEQVMGNSNVDADPASPGDLTFTALAAVPLPASLPLVLFGLAIFGFSARRKKG